MPTPELSLREFVQQVTSAASLEELLGLYKEVLAAENQISIPVLIPVLLTRIQVVEENYLDFKPVLNEASDRLEAFLSHLLTINTTAAEILAIVFAAKFDSKTQDLCSQSKMAIQHLYERLRQLFLEFNQFLLSESRTDFDGLQDNLKRLVALVEQDVYEDAWIGDRLLEVEKELHTFLAKADTEPWKEQFAALIAKIHATLPLLEATITFIIQHKNSNPLINDELIRHVNLLEEQLSDLVNRINSSVNSLYLYESKRQLVLNAIQCYLLLSNLITTNQTGSQPS